MTGDGEPRPWKNHWLTAECRWCSDRFWASSAQAVRDMLGKHYMHDHYDEIDAEIEKFRRMMD